MGLEFELRASCLVLYHSNHTSSPFLFLKKNMKFFLLAIVIKASHFTKANDVTGLKFLVASPLDSDIQSHSLFLLNSCLDSQALSSPRMASENFLVREAHCSHFTHYLLKIKMQLV
jgi:hypothetical protein